MATNLNKKNKGFSLIEMLVYIAILTMMLGIIVDVVLSVSRSTKIAKSSRAIESSAIMAFESINREIRIAKSIDVASSVLGSNPGKLVLVSKDLNGNNRVEEFYLLDGRIMQKDSVFEAGALTQPAVNVTNLKFVRYMATSTEGIRVEMTLESGAGTAYRSRNFYTSVTLR